MQQQNGLHCGCDGISVGSTKWYFAIIYTAEHYTALKSGCGGISVGSTKLYTALKRGLHSGCDGTSVGY